MGPGGSRLANYGVSAELLKICTVPEPADHHEGEGTLAPRPPGSGRGWAQLGVTLNVSLRPPEVTSHEVSWEADLFSLRNHEENLGSSLAPGWPSQGWWES